MADEEPAGKKRRLQNACDECRRRKIRCDSATAPGNICSSCVALNIECMHRLEKKKRGPKIGPSKKAHNARALVNAILSSSKPYTVPEDPEVVREILVDLANHARSLDRQLALARGTSPENETTSPSATTSPAASNDTPEPEEDDKEVADSIDQLAHEMKKVSIGHQKRHFGKMSNFMMVQSAMDARRDVYGDRTFTLAVFTKLQRPQFWKPFPWQQPVHFDLPPFVFPEEDLLHELIKIYFERHNPFFPLLHRPTFERSVAEGLHLRDRGFGATVLAVCAVASRQSNDPRTMCEGTGSAHSLGWKFFRQVPLIRESFTDPPSLYDIQLCSLATFYLGTTSTPEAGWTMIGIGIRSAQEMGIHRRSTGPQNTVEDELWKRAFWVLVSLDLFASAFLGRPRATTPDDFDVDVPVECDDEYWENSDPEKAFKQPEGKPSLSSFFATWLKLLDIIGFAQRALYSVRKSELWYGMGISGIDWKQKAVIELDSALNKFIDQIPEHLKWNPDHPDPTFFQQSALLYSTYHWVQIQVHRPFIPRPGQEAVLPFPSLAICSNAARKTVHILNILHDRQDKGMIPLEMLPNIMTPVFAAAMMLLVSIWRPQRIPKTALESEKEMTDVYRCMKMMQKYEDRYQTAGRLYDILNAVVTIGQLPRGSQSLKRPRSPGGENYNLPGSGSGPSHSQVVLEDLHDAIHSVKFPQETTPTDPTNANILYSTTFPQHNDPVSSASSSSQFQTFPDTPLDIPKVFDVGLTQPAPANVNYSQMPMASDMSIFTPNFAAANDFMLQQPDAMWAGTASTPGSYASGSDNVDFTQEDWDSFMASVDDIVSGAGEYRVF